MAEQKITLEMSAKDAEQVRAWQRGRDNIEAFNKSLGGVGTTADKVERSGDKLKRTAESIFANTRTPLEKYNLQVGQIADAYAKGHINADTFRRAVNQQKEALKNAEAANSQFAQSGIADFGKLAAGMAGIGSAAAGIATVAGVLRAEYDNLISRQKAAGEKQIAYADVIEETVRNTGGLMSGEETSAVTKKIAGEAGQSPAKVAVALSKALSAAAPTEKADIDMALEGTKAAAKYAPSLSPDDTGALAGAGILMAKQYHGTPQQAIGVMQSVGDVSLVNSQKDLVEHVIPAMGQISKINANTSGTAQEAGGLIATLTNKMGDFSGRIAGTAGIQLAQQLHERFPELSTMEAIHKIQNSPQERAKLLEGGEYEVTDAAGVRKSKKFEGLTGETKAMATFEALLTAGTDDAKALEENTKAIRTFATGAERFEQVVAQRLSIPEVRLADAKRSMEATVEQLKLGDIRGGVAGVSREGLSELLKAEGADTVSQSISKLGFEYNTSKVGGGIAPTGEVIRQLEGRAAELRAPTVVRDDGDIFSVGREVAASPEKQQVAGLLERLIEQLKANVAAGEKPVVVEVKEGRVERPKRPAAAGLGGR